ncbi:MAG: multidrug ABC transporter ATP-binding protein [Zetaproteobacteria bacterium CG_4_9_14_3_um_filter_49_83]|nr:MAG: hypothetical protein AUJ56_10215 [Zetaproteobacteria bacterium CG1_02_49_23]PIQ34402.1 MAG: multidrug ABC transporter ATP-binding protein [Zetaproteobacteria bacterium CG17_big_fil_post_rev_8_21_14_2_50_50_13]PIV30282.1 MAG: multidrug ABC transporter ATP-binding protein [Zetaproteobacteria bacterium CG02_land_8_20_14_3_00_50_9]PIY56386.1 MAG: multidrug ABC transporter ATP-binding protein [Zetaproteobacteria bacterium CG_4_10_14_0_8_um_filter_49_80]PJA34026.1 MAG: multidrug ABC transport
MNAIEVRGLGKSFAGKPAVQHLDLEIREGEIFAFLGPNGSGKTTTMRMLCGLLTPDTGEGRCLNFDVRNEQSAIRPRIGYMSQHFSLYDDLNVSENLNFVLRVYDVANAKRRKQDIIERFDLAPYIDRLAGQLSGGWKQRLSLACGLLHEPSLLLLDEPTSGVDPEARSFFWEVMQAETARGMTAMISTHYLDEVEQYCHRMAYILKGKLLTSGTPAEVIADSGLSALRIAKAGHDVLQQAKFHAGVQYAAQTTSGVYLTGPHQKALYDAASIIAPDAAVEAIAPRLEEVFLHLSRSVT